MIIYNLIRDKSAQHNRVVYTAECHHQHIKLQFENPFSLLVIFLFTSLTEFGPMRKTHLLYHQRAQNVNIGNNVTSA